MARDCAPVAEVRPAAVSVGDARDVGAAISMDETEDERRLRKSGFLGFTRQIVAHVPEPAQWALMLAGLLGVGALTKRHRP